MLTAQRTARWMKLTGLTAEQLDELALDAAKGYDDGRGRYSSGFVAGQEHAQHLPSAPTDKRLRAWGDYLIERGEHLLTLQATPFEISDAELKDFAEKLHAARQALLLGIQMRVKRHKATHEDEDEQAVACGTYFLAAMNEAWRCGTSGVFHVQVPTIGDFHLVARCADVASAQGKLLVGPEGRLRYCTGERVWHNVADIRLVGLDHRSDVRPDMKGLCFA